MIKKADCLPGTFVTVNEKKTKWNEELGSQHNGLVCYDWTPQGTFAIGDTMHEIPPGTQIEILSKPKRVANSGVHVKFKISGQEKLFAAWWICFLHKTDHILAGEAEE
jgi:hypothetical protein